MYTVQYLRSWMSVAAVAFVIGLVGAAGDASAQGRTIKVKQGHKTVIDGISIYNTGNCHSALRKPKSNKGKAKNGQVSIAWVSYTVKEGQCKGRTFKAIVVSYTPNRGFKGRDKASITYQAPRMRSGQSETATTHRRSASGSSIRAPAPPPARS